MSLLDYDRLMVKLLLSHIKESYHKKESLFFLFFFGLAFIVCSEIGLGLRKVFINIGTLLSQNKTNYITIIYTYTKFSLLGPLANFKETKNIQSHGPSLAVRTIRTHQDQAVPSYQAKF